jgi:AcrR family transcriptional regulator
MIRRGKVVPEKINLERVQASKEFPEARRGKQETRDHLLQAAMVLFAQKGYRGTSVRAVASAAGVTTGAFYSNFSSKRDIYLAIIDEIMKTMQTIVDRTVEETIEVMKRTERAKFSHEILYSPIRRLLDLARNHEALMHIVRREGLGHDPDFQHDIDLVWERLVSAARSALDRYVRAGFAKSYDTDLVARAVVSMAIAMSVHDIETKGERRDDIVSLIAAMLHGGVSQWVAWKEGP